MFETALEITEKHQEAKKEANGTIHYRHCSLVYVTYCMLRGSGYTNASIAWTCTLQFIGISKIPGVMFAYCY